MSARASLLAAAVLVLPATAPLAAQDFIWTPDRPDAVAPPGVFGDRVFAAGGFELSAYYRRISQEGIRFGSELVDPVSMFEFFEIVPLALVTDAYVVRAGLGLTDDLTVVGRGGFLTRRREQITEDFTFFVMESQGISDIELQALYGFWDSDAIRAHLHAGVSAPTGTVQARGGFDDVRAGGTLPYDMQMGAGAWGFSPGITAQVMNESGTVGGQVVGTLYLLEKGDWRHGDKVEANAWAGYRFNRFFSASARVNVLSFEAIKGFDPELEPFRDPGEHPLSFSGTRVEIPVGLNLYMPEGRWQGHRLSAELLFPVYENFDGPWLATDWSVKLGWQVGF